MDTLKIKAFLAVSKYGSFSKAAEEFSYTPSAFSHIADSLEEELGVKLFNRTHSGVEITHAGRELVKYFENILYAEKLLLSRAKEVSSDAKSVKIGAYSSVSKYFLPKLIKGFKEQYPEIKLSMTVSDNLVRLFEAGHIDIMISSEDEVRDCLWLELFTDPFVAVVPANTFHNRKEITSVELQEYPLIYAKTKFIEENFDLNKFREVINVDTEDYNSIISMIKEGVGVAILPMLEVKSHSKGVKVLKLDGQKYTRTLGINYKKSAVKNKSLNSFIEFVKKYQS